MLFYAITILQQCVLSSKNILFQNIGIYLFWFYFDFIHWYLFIFFDLIKLKKILISNLILVITGNYRYSKLVKSPGGFPIIEKSKNDFEQRIPKCTKYNQFVTRNYSVPSRFSSRIIKTIIHYKINTY